MRFWIGTNLLISAAAWLGVCACRLESPAARTVATIVDNSTVGSPVILLLVIAYFFRPNPTLSHFVALLLAYSVQATTDLAVTAANGVLQTMLAGGYVIKVSSQATYSAAASLLSTETLAKREKEHERNALVNCLISFHFAFPMCIFICFKGTYNFLKANLLSNLFIRFCCDILQFLCRQKKINKNSF